MTDRRLQSESGLNPIKEGMAKIAEASTKGSALAEVLKAQTSSSVCHLEH